jgi:hypothetical protein
VALSRGSPRVGVTDHPALWSPDLPRRASEETRRGRPAGSSAVTASLSAPKWSPTERQVISGGMGITRPRGARAPGGTTDESTTDHQAGRAPRVAGDGGRATPAYTGRRWESADSAQVRGVVERLDHRRPIGVILDQGQGCQIEMHAVQRGEGSQQR